MYDANEVADLTAAERYTAIDPPTLCDCEAEAEQGKVYCKMCSQHIRTALNLAVDFLEKFNCVDRETAVSQLIYTIEEQTWDISKPAHMRRTP